MGLLGRLLVEIVGDNSKLDKSISESKKSAKSFASDIQKLYRGAVVAAIVLVINKFSKLSAAAEETRSKFNVVFGKTAKDVNKWASTYSKSVGRSTTDTLQFLGSIGDLLKPLGFQKDAVDDLSKTVVTLANDLGSFNDMPTADVMRDIQSAMVGNFEVTKKYGVVLNEAVIKQEAMNRGLYDGKGVVDAQTKAQIALDLIIKGTNDAQGDLLRTQDSATNTSIRLASANKDLGIALGTTINTGLTPMKAIAASIVTVLGDWVTKQNDVNSLIRDLSDGVVDGDSSLATMEATVKKLNKQIESSSQFTGNLNLELEKQRDNLIAIIEGTKQQAAMEGRYGKLLEDRAEKEAAAVAAAEKALEVADLINKKRRETMSDSELQIESLQTEIDKWAEFREIAGVQEYLNGLITERNNLLIGTEEQFGKLLPITADFWDHNKRGAIDLNDAVLEINETYKTLASDGLGAFASTFKEVGAGSMSILEGMKQAVKNTISAELEGLARVALVRAAIAAATFRFGTAAKLTGAATLAYAASGFVQQLAEGGVLAPANGGVPVVMAEAGRPEMAMPLTSQATDPFADKIAQRINNTTNNNTQNFNSMFSLNDDNQMREAARRLFPYMTGEQQRRGI